ncbi:hypothetical protein GTO89_11815 [Heliobacterium gestii]|uniref:Glycoside hydrolase n=1 Tax=Heliomicrobium gestii TaxID=2699 RepID=A0A845LGL4_HELGE|nr:S-layer homology domain-containing protein [Heliomicrobium gestii]MBM7867174.1 spore germination protein YaaH [Heliomicrobium gestii]MZP43729.1 hypothetical protein [Heliomicrobium gestii]
MTTRACLIGFLCFCLISLSILTPLGAFRGPDQAWADASWAPQGEKEAFVYLYDGDRSAYQQQLTESRGNINGVFLPWLEVSKEGRLTTNADPELLRWLHSNGLKGAPFLTNNFDRTAGDAALSPQRIASLAAELVAFVDETGADGLNIDLENFSVTRRDAYVAFLQALARPLHAKGKTLSVAVAPATRANTGDWSDAYDYRAIGATADKVIVMAYDEHWATSLPGPVASIGWVENVTRYMSTLIAPEKLILGIPFYGRQWVNGKNGNGVGYKRALRLSAEYGAPIEWIADQGAFRLRYWGSNGQNELWLDNMASLQAKMRLVQVYNLAGVAAWRLGLEDPQLWNNFQPWLQELKFSDTKYHWATKEISEMVKQGLLSGSPDGKFDPDRKITRAEAIQLIARHLNLPAGSSIFFRDVPNDYWAREAISRAVKAGLINGRGEGFFAPNETMTRAELALLLQRAYSLQNTGSVSPFWDVPSTHYAAQAIAALTSRRWLTGFSDGSFQPDQAMTRAQLAVLLKRTEPTISLY